MAQLVAIVVLVSLKADDSRGLRRVMPLVRARTVVNNADAGEFFIMLPIPLANIELKTPNASPIR